MVLDTSEIAETVDNRYVTDADLLVLGNTSGTNTGDNAVNTLYSSILTNVDTNLSTGTVTSTTYGISSDGGVDDIIIPEANTTEAGLLGADKWNEIVANNDKISYTDATVVGLNSTHRTSDGSDHTFIDQSVISGSSPVFSNSNFTISTDKNYITDAGLVVLGNTSWTNTGDQTVTSLGLENVENIADLDKVISTLTQTALNSKENTLDYTSTSEGQVLSVNATLDGYTWVAASSGEASELQKITETTTGWRLLGRDDLNYGNIGSGAVDLSLSTSVSDTNGAIGTNSIAIGENTSTADGSGLVVDTSTNIEISVSLDTKVITTYSSIWGFRSQEIVVPNGGTIWVAMATGTGALGGANSEDSRLIIIDVDTDPDIFGVDDYDGSFELGYFDNDDSNYWSEYGTYVNSTGLDKKVRVMFGNGPDSTIVTLDANVYLWISLTAAQQDTGNAEETIVYPALAPTTSKGSSFAQGIGTKSIFSGSVALGKYNVGTSLDTILEVGIGDDITRANALEVYTDGRIIAPKLSLLNQTDKNSLVTKSTLATMDYGNLELKSNYDSDYTPANVSNFLFGSVIAKSTTKMAVGGRYEGKVRISDLDGSNEVEIIPSLVGNDFGASIVISDTKIFIGDPSYSANIGRVFIFDLDGTNEIIIENPNAVEDVYFGLNLAINSSKLLIGGSFGCGAFTANLDGTSITEIVPATINSIVPEWFGQAVAMNETTLFIGAPGTKVDPVGTRSGAVFTFNIDGSNQQMITSGYTTVFELFGSTIKINDTKMVIGTGGLLFPFVTSLDTSGLNKAFITNLDGSEMITIEPDILISPDGSFGISIDCNDDYILIGDSEENGAVHLFNFEGTKLITLQPLDAINYDNFGIGVSINNSNIVIGSVGDTGEGKITRYSLPISDFLTNFGDYETSHNDVLVDGDFATSGIMSTDGAGTYSIKTIGTDIQAFDANIVSDATYVATQESYTTVEQTKVSKIEVVGTLADGAGVAVNMGVSSQFELTTTQNFTLSNPTGQISGQRGFIVITQDATGSRILTLDSNYKTAGGTGITLTTTASAVDIIRYEVISPTLILVELVADIK